MLFKKLRTVKPKRLQQKVYPYFQDNGTEPLVLEPLVLLHGWGFDSGVWQNLIRPLQNFTQVITLDLPGFGDNRWAPWTGEENVCEEIVATMPAKAVYVGWSLGGMLATKIAARFPNRVAGIITLATNISFVARGSWPYGMSIGAFDDFYNAVDKNPEQALKRFYLLVSQGDQLNSRQFKWLQNTAAQSVDHDNLLLALSSLEEMSNCDQIHKLQMPGLHIFGERDQLVPLSAVQKLMHLSMQYNNHRQQYHVLKNTGHLVFWPSDRVTHFFEAFLTALQHYNN